MIADIPEKIKEQDFFDVMSMVKQLTAGDVNADGTNPGVL